MTKADHILEMIISKLSLLILVQLSFRDLHKSLLCALDKIALLSFLNYSRNISKLLAKFQNTLNFPMYNFTKTEN